MYAPTQDLMTGIRNAFPEQMFPWDDYFPRMAETDFLDGVADEMAVKSFFMRTAPFGGSFALLGGVTAMLRGIGDVDFTNPDFRRGMEDMDYHKDFLDHLAKHRRLRLKIYSPLEGDVIFPNEPGITAVGPLADIRLWEGIVTEAVNYPTLSLTKWHRMVQVVRPGEVMEFARRRAQHAQKTTLYSQLGGASSTSHSDMRRFFDFLVKGTMGHEFVQSRGRVLAAFRAWVKSNPRRSIGLVDTTECMEIDFPTWLDVVCEYSDHIRSVNPKIWGWRNDSGDLAYLTIEQYITFLRHPLAKDEFFADRMRIILTNDLDEYKAQSIIAQIRTQAGAAGLNAEDIIRRIIWAAGTLPGTCQDQPSLGGVAKLMEAFGYETMKLAFDSSGKPGVKTSIPGFNLSALIRDERGQVVFPLVFPARRYTVLPEGKIWDLLAEQIVDTVEGVNPDNPQNRIKVSNYHATARQRLIYDSIDGSGLTSQWDTPTIDGVRKRVRESVGQLHWTVTRLDKPQVMNIMVTQDLYDRRANMIEARALRADDLFTASL
jgi:nicotinate phosphoribosyltransferase